MAWAAVVAVARSELRRRWVSLVALGVLAGLVAATVIGAATMARRSATAHDRLEQATHVDDVRINLLGAGLDPAEIESLPPVATAWTSRGAVGQLMGGDLIYSAISSGPPPPPGLFTPVVMDGRAPRADAADEALISEPMAEEMHIGVGDVLHIKLLSLEEMGMWDVGFGEPDGPLVQLKVTGVARMTLWGAGMGHLLASPAFEREYADNLAGAVTLVKLKPGATPGALTDALDALVASKPELRAMQAQQGDEAPPFYDIALPATQDDETVRTTQRVLVGGLCALAGVLAVAGLLGVAQGLGRHHAAGAGEQRVEHALGLTTAERTLARVAPAGIGAAVAVAVAVAGGLAAGWLEPLGALKDFEPHPGWAPNIAFVAVGAILTGALFLAVAAGTAARAGRRTASASVPAGAPRTVTAAARRASLLAGAYFALSPGRGRSAVPVRTTVIGAVLGIAGVVGAATFGASLDRLGDEPARYGWNADFALVDAKDPDVDALAADPRVEGVTVITEGTVRVGPEFAATATLTRQEGNVPWTVFEGRLPARADEIAVGPRLAERTGAGVGDTVTARDPAGKPVPLRVVGVALTPPSGSVRFGTTAVLTPATFSRLNAAPAYATALVRAVDRDAGDALYSEMSQSHELTRATPPREVANLTDLGDLPRVLALLLAALAAAVLGHALVLTVSRRGRDIAVLRAIGFTPRQVAGAVLTSSAVTAFAGLLVGVPLGIALGRLVWAEVASGSGVAGDVLVPGRLLAATAAVVVVVAALLALLPAARAARLSPAAQLRAE